MEYIYGKNDLFALILILKDLLTKNDFTDIINEISYEVSKLDGIVDTVELSKILSYCGFPENWEEISKID